MSKLLILLFFIVATKFSFSQDNGSIRFVPVFHGERIELNKKYLHNEQWFQFENLRFYISDLRISAENYNWIDSTKIHLMDLADSTSLHIKHSINSPNSISFNIGIDSSTNVSGILDGDLDPIKGMYWAWNSGYINFKLEGKSSLSANPDNSFEFHLGGYLQPFPTIQLVEIPLNSKDQNIVIEIEISTFLQKADLSSKNSLMIPGKEAMELSKILPLLFKIQNNAQ